MEKFFCALTSTYQSSLCIKILEEGILKICHPCWLCPEAKIYQLVPPLEHFKISKFSFSWNHFSFTLRTWIKSQQVGGPRYWHAYSHHIVYTAPPCTGLLGRFYPDELCFGGITSGRTTESRGLRQEPAPSSPPWDGSEWASAIWSVCDAWPAVVQHLSPEANVGVVQRAAEHVYYELLKYSLWFRTWGHLWWGFCGFLLVTRT